MLTKKLETKQSISTYTRYAQVQNNEFITVDVDLLKTIVGFSDPKNTNVQNRIDDEITLKGVNLKFMLEINADRVGLPRSYQNSSCVYTG